MESIIEAIIELCLDAGMALSFSNDKDSNWGCFILIVIFILCIVGLVIFI